MDTSDFERTALPSASSRRGSSTGRRSGPGAGVAKLGVGARLVLAEVLAEEAGEPGGRGVVGGLVGPGLPRDQDLARDARAFGDDADAEDRVGRRGGVGQGPAVDRVDDGAGVGQLHARAGAVRRRRSSRC